MSDGVTVLRRKLAPSRPSSVPGGSSVEAMLRKTMPRDADDLLSLDLAVISVQQGKRDKAGLLDDIQPTDLIYLMDGEDEARGICKISPSLLAGLTEIQMSGRVTSSDPPERVPTRTDGIVAGEIVDRWISTATDTSREENLTDALPIAGFQRANGVLDKRNTDLSIDPQTYRTMTIELSLGGGAKSGTLFFATPEPGGSDSAGQSKAATQMRKHLPQIEAPLRAVLVRLPVGVGRVQRMAVGDLVEVPIESLQSVRLEGMDGRMIAMARLGQLNGMRAVRLAGEEAPRAALAAPAAEVAVNAAEGLSAELSPVPDLPDLPDIPPADEGTGLPELPDLPDLPAPGDEGHAGLPDLPELPDLPDLPDLPALPDLPD